MRRKIVIRVFAGLLCLVTIWTFYIDFQRAREILIYDTFNLIALIVVFPIFAITAILGTFPNFIISFFSKNFLEGITNAEQLFTKFDIASVTFALVAISMLFYYMFTHT